MPGICAANNNKSVRSRARVYSIEKGYLCVTMCTAHRVLGRLSPSYLHKNQWHARNTIESLKRNINIPCYFIFAACARWRFAALALHWLNESARRREYRTICARFDLRPSSYHQTSLSAGVISINRIIIQSEATRRRSGPGCAGLWVVLACGLRALSSLM